MKKVFLASFLFTVSCLVFTACSKSSSNPLSTLSATIDGSSFVASTIVPADSGSTLLIEAYDGTGSGQKTFYILLSNYNNSTGTYSIDSINKNAGINYSDGAKQYTGRSGSVVVDTALSRNAAGNFSVNLVNNSSPYGTCYQWQI